LNSNELSGEIGDFSQNVNLKVLDLGGNGLTGKIPDFSKTTALKELWLQNNKLAGELPLSLIEKKASGCAVYLSDNTGFTLPDMGNLAQIYLGTNHHPSRDDGSSDLYYYNTTSVGWVKHTFNRCEDNDNWKGHQNTTGECTAHCAEGKFQYATYMTRGDKNCACQNSCEEQKWQVTEINLNDMALSGPVPDFSKNTALKRLYLNSNELSGEIGDFSQNVNLKVLDLGGNGLTGKIPDFSKNTALQKLLLSGNKLTGSIPDFSNNTALRGLWFGRNELTGASEWEANKANYPPGCSVYV